MATTEAINIGTMRATLCACCATLLGVGLGRFAYTPLIPALITAHWFTPGGAAYLGAANLAGYVAGALLGRELAARAPAVRVLRAMMVLATATFFACATPVSFAWFFVWRVASGLSGGVLMVVAASVVLPHVAAARRGLAGGVILTGVGLGIAASGGLVPFLAPLGLAGTWRGLGIVALALTAVAWRGWPEASPAALQPAPLPRPRASLQLRAQYLEYGLNAAGLVPHMVFVVDFIARGLGLGLATGAHYWVILGLGAMIGPTLLGHLADRAGFAAAVRCGYVVQAGFIGLAAVAPTPLAMAASCFAIGALIPGITTLVLGRVRLLATGGVAGQTAAWGVATTFFSLGQAAGGYGFSYLFARSDDYRLLFALGAAMLVLALIVNLLASAGRFFADGQRPER
jgi:predicted MFS family arabinose efflux permease